MGYPTSSIGVGNFLGQMVGAFPWWFAWRSTVMPIPELQVRLFNEYNATTGNNTNRIELSWLPKGDVRFLECNPQIWLFRQKSKQTSTKKYIQNTPFGMLEVIQRKKIASRFAHPKSSGVGAKLSSGTEFSLPVVPKAVLDKVQQDIHGYEKYSTFSLELNPLEWFTPRPVAVPIPHTAYKIKGQRNKSGRHARKCEYLTFAICIDLPYVGKVLGVHSRVIKYAYDEKKTIKFSLSYA